MSVIARCAATPRICDRPKLVTAWTTVATPAARAIGSSSSCRPLPITSSMTYFDERRQHDAGQAADQHQRQADRQPAAMRPDQLADLAPRRRGVDLLLRRVGGRPRRAARPARRARSALRMLGAPDLECIAMMPSVLGHESQFSAFGTASVNGAIARLEGRRLRRHHRVFAVHRPDRGLQRGSSWCSRRSAPGASTGCSPTTPSPRTSSSSPSVLVITQCRLISCAVSLPTFEMRM